MGLLAELDSKDKKGLFRDDDTIISYSTGILPFDYANGYWQEIRTPEGEIKSVPILGITGGTFGQIFGTTGSGKTSLAQQIGYNIIRPFEDGVLYHIDAEKTANRQRLIQMTGADYDDPRLKIIKSHTSIEDVLEMVNRICEVKEAGGSTYMYEIANRSFTGKPMKVYIPTVFIIDSLPSFNSKEYNTDDLGNNIDQMKAAKDITRFYTNCLDKAWKYNITFIVVNHIRPKADMNPYAAPPRGLMMLGPQETLPRGSVAQYYSQWAIRLNAKKSDAYTREDHGFKGYKMTMQVAKSKTNEVGVSFPVAFNSAKGFEPIYTLYEFAQSIGLISGRNPYLYFEGLDTFKFNRKDFVRKMNEEREFRESVLTILRPHLEAMLGEKNLPIPDTEGGLKYGDLVIDDYE